MPQIHVACEDGHLHEVYRHHSDWPTTPPCALCGKATEQKHLPSHMAGHTVDPVVVYLAPDGTYRFPPDRETSMTSYYDNLGYKRIEARGWAEVRALEGRLNAQQRSEIGRRMEVRQERWEAAERDRRAEVRRGIEQGFVMPVLDREGLPTGQMQTVRLTPRMLDVMRAAMDRNDRKENHRSYEPGIRVEAYSEDRSNRDRDVRRRDQ